MCSVPNDMSTFTIPKTTKLDLAPVHGLEAGAAVALAGRGESPVGEEAGALLHVLDAVHDLVDSGDHRLPPFERALPPPGAIGVAPARHSFLPRNYRGAIIYTVAPGLRQGPP